MQFGLDEEEKLVLLQSAESIEADRFPLSPPTQTLQRILAKAQ
jgi:hypothetical protein